jgi:hypothetical protein
MLGEFLPLTNTVPQQRLLFKPTVDRWVSLQTTSSTSSSLFINWTSVQLLLVPTHHRPCCFGFLWRGCAHDICLFQFTSFLQHSITVLAILKMAVHSHQATHLCPVGLWSPSMKSIPLDFLLWSQIIQLRKDSSGLHITINTIGEQPFIMTNSIRSWRSF